MTSWRPYLRDRLIYEDPEEFVVIVPKDFELPTPLTCPVCEHVLRSQDDEVAYAEFKCCGFCAERWAHARKKAWMQDGWRPTSEQIASIEHERPMISIVFKTD